MQFSVRVEGAREIERMLKELPARVQDKIVRQALPIAFQPVLTTARALVPRRTGELASHLGITKPRRAKHKFWVRVGTAEGLFKGRQFYAGFVELGHRLGHRRLGNKRKWVPPQPTPKGFLRAAFNANETGVLKTLAMLLRAGIIREARLLAK